VQGHAKKSRHRALPAGYAAQSQTGRPVPARSRHESARDGTRHRAPVPAQRSRPRTAWQRQPETGSETGVARRRKCMHVDHVHSL